MEEDLKQLNIGETRITKDFLRKVLDGFIKQAGLNGTYEIESFVSNPGAKAGENFLSDLWAVDVTTVFHPLDLNQNVDTEQTIKKTHHLMFKCVPPARVSEFDNYGTFRKEGEVYQKLFPALIKHQVSRGVKNPQLPVPKCYYVQPDGPNAMLVLENLKPSGFRMIESSKGFDVDHFKLVIEAVSKFHAISHSFAKENPNIIANDLAQALIDTTANPAIHDTFSAMEECLYNLSISVISKIPKAAMYAERMQSLKGQFHELLSKYINKSPIPIYSICHGDCWINNFMFRYETIDGKNVPVEVKIVDWQIARHNNPGLDIAFLALSGTSKEFREANMKQMLLCYQQKFVQTLTGMNEAAGSPEVTPEFVNQMYEGCKHFGLVFWLPLILIMGLKAHERPIGMELWSLGKEEMQNHKAFQVETYPPDSVNMLVDLVVESIESGLF